MTPSLSLLTALPPTPNLTDPPGTDRTKRNTMTVLPPLPLGGASTAHPGLSPAATTTTPTAGSSSSALEPERNTQCDGASADRTGTTPRRALAACPWTGAPIRAIVPLPSRSVHGCDGPARTTVPGPSSCWMRSAPVWDDMDVHTDSGSENGEEGEEEEEEEEEGSDEDCDTTSASRCYSYESITAAEGLSAWSFEELRVECYAQSLVARGTRPPPAVQPALAIPPAFVPRFVPRS